METMTPASPRWNDFIKFLHDSGCDPDYGLFRCTGDQKLPAARNILEAMGNVDVEDSLAFLSSRVHCDCGIVTWSRGRMSNPTHV